MVDLLKVTTPLTGQESLGRTKLNSPREDNILSIPDPSKVTKTNSQSVYSERQAGQFSPNLKSNFEEFLQLMRSTPDMTEGFSKIFFTRLGSIVNSGMGQGISEEMSTYMDMLKMTEPELLNFVKEGQGAAVKFNGVFFDMLRYLLKGNVSNDLKGSILDFLRKYDSLTGGNHILNNMVSNLKNVAVRIPQSVSTQLSTLVDKLVISPENGANEKNVDILKNEIVPLLAKYMSRARDFGPVRDIISMFVLNLARYEMGTKESFSQSFRTLVGYAEVQSQLEGVPMADLEQFMLSNKVPEAAHATVDKLIQVITKGVNGEAGYENKQIFQNILNSALVNESVYMPLVHIMLPADINGKLFFSEMWVDPNHEQGNKREGGQGFVKMLIKFDIKDLGYFEMILLAQGDKVDMELLYPERLEPLQNKIREELQVIMERNDLSFQSLFLGKCEEPKSISQVFPKIYEGRNVVNVTI